MNRALQYGLLFVFYLSRSGRSTIDVISQNIDVPKSFLGNIARELIERKIIKSIRGIGGGYELVGDPTVAEVFSSLNSITLMSPQELSSYRRGETEHRALARLVDDLYFSLGPVYDRSVRDVVKELVQAEVFMMNKLQSTARAN